jgi:3-deoxy-D-manno-octulosonic-acid transferase
VPLALVNARISDTSARNWKRLPATARHLMGHFRLIHCQDARTAAHLHDLGLDGAAQGVNLKALAGPLPVDCDARDRLRTRLGQRPVWVAASTHPGEDGIMLAAHRALLEDHPDALLILVPRHPERAGDIAGDIARAGLTQARRSTGAPPETATQVYLADTLGETGLWYDLAPLTCLCGSFSDVGGHNPYEPAHAGCAILHGPRYANFAQTYAEMDAAGAARQVTGAEDLAQALRHLCDTPDDRAALAEGARAFATAQEDALDEMTATLSKALGLR